MDVSHVTFESHAKRYHYRTHIALGLSAPSSISLDNNIHWNCAGVFVNVENLIILCEDFRICDDLLTMRATLLTPTVFPVWITLKINMEIEQQDIEIGKWNYELIHTNWIPGFGRLIHCAPLQCLKPITGPAKCRIIINATKRQIDPVPVVSIQKFVVEKAVREIIKPLMCGGDLIPGLNLHIHKLITQASERANFNRRKTLRACDL
jgi:hypothetical protein